MKKNLALITAILFASILQAQTIDYDNLAKEYQDVAIRALASVKPSTKKWVEETALKHPPGKFDKYWVNSQLAGIGGGEDIVGGLWAVMFAYQRMMNKEVRGDRKMAIADAKVETKLKMDKIAQDNKAIDQGMQESRERYDNAMQAANTEAGKGISSSSTQVTNNRLQVKQDSLKQKTATGGDKQLQKTIASGESKDASEASRDHRRAMQDNIQKMLDQLAEMQRSGKF